MLLSAIGAALAAGILATLELSLSMASRGEVEDLARRRGDARAGPRIERVFGDMWSHLRAAAVLRLALSAGTVCAMGVYVARERGAGMGGAGGAGGGETLGAVGGVDLLVGAAGGVVMLWVSTVAMPIAAARYAAARVVLDRLRLVRALEGTLMPLRRVGRVLDELVRRLIGAEARDAEQEAQAELMSVIEESRATGALSPDEHEMLEAVMRFRDRTVREIMTPRTDIEAMEYTDELGAITRRVKEIGHSRIPVYEEDLDHVRGVFYVKDLMHWLAGGTRGSGKPFQLHDVLRPALMVPATKTVRELLRELLTRQVHIALVLDEYGGTAGLVTIEDIVEEVFGEIRDEYEVTDPDAPDVLVRPDGHSAEINAAARVEDVNAMLEAVGVQIPVGEDYDTVAGYVMTALGRVPARGEQLQVHPAEHPEAEPERAAQPVAVLTVLDAQPNRVIKVGLALRQPSMARAEQPAAPGPLSEPAAPSR
ncbi:MAG: hypothetical protein C0513_06290 [Isosphaera sp.]|nr:hypothetical protein [Isosphaera sp.]